MSQNKNNYEQFFLNPTIPRHKHYEMMRARFVDNLSIKEIAEKFAMSSFTVQSYIRDFKKRIDEENPHRYFLEPSPGPKEDRKKHLVRKYVLRLRKLGYASTDIHKALKLADKEVSLSLIDQILREEGLTGMKRRTREDQARVSKEVETRRVPGLTIPEPATPIMPAVADINSLDLCEDRKLRSRLAGVFLFTPLLVEIGLHEIVSKAKMIGTNMIPAMSYLLSLLALKLLDKERKSCIDDWNCDEGLGMFAGLNILPKKEATTDYSYRLVNDEAGVLMGEWVKAVYPILCPEGARAFALDFHPIPHRGEASSLENHYVPSKGKAQPSILTFFARTIENPMLCYANADIIREEQANMPLVFVDYWKSLTGVKPAWLYFDSKVTTYKVLGQLANDNVHFITVRRRGRKMVANAFARPSSDWISAIIDTPQRKHQKIKYLDDHVRLRGYGGIYRQVAVKGLGRQVPSFFLTNNEKITGRDVIVRYTNRNYIENDLGINVNFFHLDCLASEVRLNVNLDVVLTIIANGCYRWLSKQMKGYENIEPKQLYRKFVETSGDIILKGDDILVRLERRAHNPVIAQAVLDKKPVKIPWLNNKRLRFEFK